MDNDIMLANYNIVVGARRSDIIYLRKQLGLNI